MSISSNSTIHHRTATIDGLDIFYREAGPADAPAVVLLHGFPTSSHMFRHLIPALADRWHVIAPDLPGFGFSAMPPRETYTYGFAGFADAVDGLLQALGIGRYALYLMDYGAPTGFRLALKHPEQVAALITQNGNAYEDGLPQFWDAIRTYWTEGTPAARETLRPFTTLAATKSQYLDGVADPTRIDPATWTLDQALLDRPGNAEIQLDLLYDYRTNVALYPAFQDFFRTHRPPTLIAWGANDVIFPPAGARAFLRDLPDAELHLLDSGHFALEDMLDDYVRLIRGFLGRVHSGATTT